MIKAFADPHNTQEHGMELRDWFAGQVLSGLLANPETKPDSILICKASYKIADQMLKARESNE